MQPAEIRDLLNDFWTEARLLIQESHLFLPAAPSSSKFWAARCSAILLLHHHLSGDFPAHLLVYTELQTDKVEVVVMPLWRLYACIQYDMESIRCVMI